MKTTAQIAVFLPLRQLFHYAFDAADQQKLIAGVRVVVPFRNRDVVGVFIKFGKSDMKTKKIKSLLDEKPIFPKQLVELALWCADYYLCGPGELFGMIGPKDSLKKRVTYSRTDKETKKLKGDAKLIYENLNKPLTAITLAQKVSLTVTDLAKKSKTPIKNGYINKKEEYYFAEARSQPTEWERTGSGSLKPIKKKQYTKEQNKVVNELAVEIERQSGSVTLLHGVTGSGKTEVYIALCEAAIKNGGSAILLVPEIALTFQLVKRFYAVFKEKVAILHSGLTPAQRRNEWMRAQKGDASIVIGARSALFAPLKNIRLIVVDEEHDSSYKQTESPHYNARDLAVVLGRITGAPVLLGSATPSLESYYNAETGKYSLKRLTKRIDDRKMPSVTPYLEDTGDNKILPTAIVEKILSKLDRKEQSLIFINRRGAAIYVKCSLCKSVVACPNCSITLTYHSVGNRLTCHYCGYNIASTQKCPECGIGKTFNYKGLGTQKVESYLKELFPKIRVGRLDRDTAPTREKVFRILENFEKGKTDILVGTQMIAKGHDFDNLTYSVIMDADDYLSFPDFRSAEKTFSLITQAAGRTGRGSKGGEVAVIGSTDHYAIKHALTHDYSAFYKEEIEKRRTSSYPPFSRLAGIMFDSTSEKQLEDAMDNLMNNIDEIPRGITPLGPVPALIYKVRNRYRWKMILKGKNSRKLHEAVLAIESATDRRIAVSIDIDPIGFY